MTRKQYNHPAIFVVHAEEIPLSNTALVELMREILNKGMFFRFRAFGSSMSPFVRDGDIVTITTLKDALPKMGDIVAFQRPDTGKLVVHRVVARKGLSFLIQGDNTLNNPDGLVPSVCILGRVKHIERNGRLVSLGLGMERYLIAWLSQRKLFTALRSCYSSFFSRQFHRENDND